MQETVEQVVAAAPGVRWSIRVTDLGGQVLAAHEPERRLSTASIGKVLLLAETARRLELGTLDPNEPLTRTPELAVADSGLWQHLRSDTLPVADVAVLVAAASDNYATNVLLERIGLDHVAALAAELGLTRTSLNDRVRGARHPEHPDGLSYGAAGELAGVMAAIARGELVSPAVSAQLDEWLATGLDLSMVASAFHFDPLAHVTADRGYLLRNKTGTDDGIRADIGWVRGPAGDLAYAVLANWDAAGDDHRDAVLAGMRRIGVALRG